MNDLKKRFEENELICEKVIDLFTLFSNKARFRILCMLLEGDFCVTEIVETVKIGKISNVSQQLRLLTLAGLLEKRRDKKRIIYHLKDEKIKKVIQFFQENYL